MCRILLCRMKGVGASKDDLILMEGGVLCVHEAESTNEIQITCSEQQDNKKQNPKIVRVM